MAKVIRVFAVTLTTVFSFILLGAAYAFGRCEGWKGTGTCPRVPLWDWEVFWIAFWAGVLPTVAIRVGRGRVTRALAEAIVAGISLGSIVVVITGS